MANGEREQLWKERIEQWRTIPEASLAGARHDFCLKCAALRDKDINPHFARSTILVIGLRDR